MDHAAAESPPSPPPPLPAAERSMTFAERAVAAAGASVMSAVLVNPLDVAKMWSDFRCYSYPSCSTGSINGLGQSCSPQCFQYRGTMDVFSKVTRQAFKGSNVGGKPPGMWKTLLGVLSSRQTISSPQNCIVYFNGVSFLHNEIHVTLGMWAFVAGRKVSAVYSEVQALVWHAQDLQWALSFHLMKLSSTSCTKSTQNCDRQFFSTSPTRMIFFFTSLVLNTR
ncbi:hypothetical protein PR202_ga24226 [Eleusine coracana subsp. coracana]|uniref:Uncharacterized protein n=1 Tax=Eleusine coracana subsp. coracana TaxID=191504 RepID=A0AAV5D7U8_ELECO|nr:hypothetical protein PR202_ga24226 [Eleusine coracana subsp. coracana]